MATITPGISIRAHDPVIKPIQNALKEFIDSAPIRIIKADLFDIRELLALHSDKRDETTEVIRIWHRNFVSSLAVDGNVPRVLNEFIPLLQEILVDPIPRMINAGSTVSLDDPRLGSDGRIYSFRSLTVFFSSPEIDPKRSPLRQNDPAPFTISSDPHPVAAHLVKWLKKCKSHLKDLESDETFRMLMLEGRAVAVPSSGPIDDNIDEIARQILAEEAAREKRRNEARQKGGGGLESLRERLIKRIEVAVPTDRITEISDRLTNTLTANRIRDAEKIAKEDAQAKNLKERADMLELAHRENEQKIKEIQAKISDSNRQIFELDKSIAQVKMALQEREKSWVSGLLITAAVIAACIVAQQLAAAYLASTGTGTGLGASSVLGTGADLSISIAPFQWGSQLGAQVKLQTIPHVLKQASVLALAS